MELKRIPKTEQQLTVDLRNTVAARLVEQKASEQYWRIVADKAGKDTQERVDALNKVAINQQLTSRDKLFLKVIDEMLEE